MTDEQIAKAWQQHAGFLGKAEANKLELVLSREGPAQEPLGPEATVHLFIDGNPVTMPASEWLVLSVSLHQAITAMAQNGGDCVTLTTEEPTETGELMKSLAINDLLSSLANTLQSPGSPVHCADNCTCSLATLTAKYRDFFVKTYENEPGTHKPAFCMEAAVELLTSYMTELEDHNIPPADDLPMLKFLIGMMGLFSGIWKDDRVKGLYDEMLKC